MYIKTALYRLNAFRLDDDKRYSFPTTYLAEPYAAYCWGEIMQLAACYPHVVDTDGTGNPRIRVDELGITLHPVQRTITERTDGYVLVTEFPGRTSLPSFTLTDESGGVVYTRISGGLLFRRNDSDVVGGRVNEEWFFKDAKWNSPKSIKQSYLIESGPTTSCDSHRIGKVTITYTTAENKIIEDGIVAQCTGYRGIEYSYYRDSYSVFDGKDLIVRYQTGNRFTDNDKVVCLLDDNGVVRKQYDGGFTTLSTAVKWFDASGKQVTKGKMNFITHSYELAVNDAEAALRKSGAIEYNTRRPEIEEKFRLNRCPEFPIPAKETENV